MDRLVHRPELVALWSAAAIFICAGFTVAIAVASDPRHSALIAGESSALCGAAAPVVLVCAVAALSRSSRLGYVLGLLGGSLALYWLILDEVAQYPLSSWRFLNYWGEASPDEARFLLSTKFRLLSMATASATFVCASLRLLPARFELRGSSWHLRTWPAFAIYNVILVAWFVCSVNPYRSPNWDHQPPPEFLIARVERKGIHFHETGVSGWRDGRVQIWQDDRRLFEYRFETRVASGFMSQAAREHALGLVHSPEVFAAYANIPARLRLCDVDGWYAVVNKSRVFAFGASSGTALPRRVTDLFFEIKGLPMVEEKSRATRDVCLGFCFDFVSPLAGIPR